MVNQREVGPDVGSFNDGLRSALREDPDVVLLGEMRDLDSIQISLSLAETGHLVFATLHTNDAAQALDRIIDVFPSERRDQIQIMLAGALQGVISQRLMPSIGGGRVAAYEVMVANEAIRNLVREGKSRQMRNMISTGAGEGMQTIEMDLARLVAAGLITMETAMEGSQYPKEVQAQLATARAQMHAHSTLASGQAGSSGSGTYGGAPVTSPGAPPPPPPAPAPVGSSNGA
jgi:twitching motility protein PilT